MINYRKILELHFSKIPQRSIEVAVGSSRNTIREVIKKAKEKELIELTDEMSNKWLERYLFPEKHPQAKGYYQEDWDYVHKELSKAHMTLKLLHKEYCQRAKDNQAIPYAYRTYCEQYGDYAGKYKVTMPLKHKPGAAIECDWAGSTLKLKDKLSNNDITVYIFVGTLPFSQYSYVEGFLDMKSSSWLTAHIHMFDYFKGVTQTIIPDNLRTGVTKTDYAEPVINESYRELADYYQTVVVPTRALKPKDKSSVEGAVGLVSRQIIASLRNTQCFYLQDLNQLIWEKLEELNTEAFQKKEGSRRSVFEQEELPYLLPVRKPAFQLTEWRIAKVQLNYHIQVESNYYSVPYEYVQCDVEVRLTKNLIEVYFNQSRIASHKRIKKNTNERSTLPDHMPDHHRRYHDHTPETVRKWAKEIGLNTVKLVNLILEQQVEKRALKILGGIQNLEKNYSIQLIEETSEILLSITQQPTLATFKTIIQRQYNYKNKNQSEKARTNQANDGYGYSRGSEYFRRNNL
ncbi:IS21 family transposase [Fundicoccus culcitae]|uniref:IS21 family transposase n=1 Tax=Fundicoccus culcitae TaxID=2969821 RepID=A0ABY5PA27_9LACT|nr:IS21 family transposase [Fundicoccus culcitae]UUX35235.1 IS21 family transposase [Fundicoccus culcitae]